MLLSVCCCADGLNCQGVSVSLSIVKGLSLAIALNSLSVVFEALSFVFCNTVAKLNLSSKCASIEERNSYKCSLAKVD